VIHHPDDVRRVLATNHRPPGWLLARRSIGPDRVGGYALPPGTDVFLSPFVVHRHPAIWENAESFDPGRFGGRTRCCT
jgi:cytochrome P450